MTPKRVSAIPGPLFKKLLQVRPSFSRDGYAYRPCQVTLNDGSVHPRAYVQDYEGWHREWLIEPFDPTDPDWRWIDIDDVADIEESPFRLPPDVATAIWKLPEWGMGFTVFTLVTKDGSSYPYVGSMGDYYKLPENVSPQDIVGIGEISQSLLSLPRREMLRHCLSDDYGFLTWCIYDGVDKS